ncbi:MAG: penicillin-binding protein 1A [Rhodospirillaceae bacterium]|nr:MAG: penicillin-binding protein 1A [Rhodospirillaceae bacterium]
MLPKSLGTWLAVGLCVILVGVFCAGAAAIYLVTVYGRDLPDVQQLANYQPPVMTRVYAADGRLLQEYATEGRVFVPITAIPKRVAEAFISAEDQNFYEHHGIDFVGIFRSAFTNVEERLAGNERRMKGASTITQQVVQNFLLGKEYTFSRKIREAILSVRIEQAFTKDHILELYLNEINLGFHSYGVAAAAMNYFNKPLDELTVSEAAFLAALPKAPNNYNPERHPEAARDRRDYVVGRMLEDGYITAAEAEEARHDEIVVRKRGDTEIVTGGAYFAEEVRRELSTRYGDDQLYQGGLSVRTSLDPFLQEIADRVLHEGLIRYDRRHGWRGPVTHLDGTAANVAGLKAVPAPAGMPESWQLALVEDVASDNARILLASGKSGTIPLPELTWARQWLPDQLRGNAITKASQVLHEGDVIMVARDKRPGADDPPEVRLSPGLLPEGIYGLRQIPQVDGALVVMDPHTGRVLALTGGFSIARSQFDRATQAMRQPGSSFKPFVYLTAMENGFTPSTLVLDAPIVIDVGPGQPKWKPHNYEEGDYLGLAPLRVGLEKSHNLMTVRLAQAVGMDKVADTAEKFGIVDTLPQFLSSALGAEVTTPLRLTTAYAELVNGGRKITATMIDRVQDRNGRTIYRYDTRPCADCNGVVWNGQPPPELPDTREQIADPASVYQIVHMLEGVVERGTGRVVSEVGKPLAGKTGTSNDIKDTWFEGFSPDLAAGVFVGFDDPPRTLGPKEQGATVAAPIFRDFMMEALKDKPATPFRVPEGISFIRINHDTGKPAEPGDKTVILEAFKTGTSPFSQATIMGQSDNTGSDLNTPAQPSAGGLY